MKYENFYILFGVILAVLSYFAGHSDGFYDGMNFICEEELFITEQGQFKCLDEQDNLPIKNLEGYDVVKIQYE